jgi:serine/threonine protein phosphatase 1
MERPKFATDVNHVHIDERAWDGIYVLGDVHGCLREFDRMIDRLGVTEDDLVAVVGDLVRKGPDSAGVVDRVRGMENVVTVRGNNEEKFLTGEKERADAGLRKDHVAWIAAQPAAISFGDALVVHGGVDPRKGLDEHTVAELQNTRSLSAGYERPFWWDVYNGPRTVFFGHTPLAAPVLREHAVGLDTGCVYGNQLTAYDCRTGDLHVVNPVCTHEERAASKFVEPKSGPDERDPLVA